MNLTHLSLARQSLVREQLAGIFTTIPGIITGQLQGLSPSSSFRGSGASNLRPRNASLGGDGPADLRSRFFFQFLFRRAGELDGLQFMQPAQLSDFGENRDGT